MEPDREQRLALLRSDLAYLVRKVAKWTPKQIGQVGLGYFLVIVVGRQVSRFLRPEEQPTEGNVREPLESWIASNFGTPVEALLSLLFLAGMCYGCYLLVGLVANLAHRLLRLGDYDG